MKSIEVAAAIIQENGRILATQRGYGNYEGYWEFPGGKLEPGESGEQAVVRELEEEMGAEVAVDRHVISVEYDYPEFHLLMHCYLCHVVQGELKLLEHHAAKWLAADQLDSVKWLGADIEVLEAIKEQGIVG
ncbi:MAG: (deoxy)nucleoside triphosphate pyrophosphohydrolase [Coriobacteriia bacterium]|nr:(deoxy)nucleoside triphosphate pyrophosphohydrolase [Coriobacteriia bacterium]